MAFTVKDNEIFYEVDGKILGEVDFPQVAPGVVDICHTAVDPSLQGQGIAGQLMAQTALVLERSGRRAQLSCSYAQKWFAGHPEYASLVEK